MTESTDPTHWSLWTPDTIRLHGTPQSSASLEVRGYRDPIDWVAQGAGASPDLPEELHPCLTAFILGRAYLQQEDEALAHENINLFEAQLDRFKSRIHDMPGSTPVVLNGTHSYGRWGQSLPARLRYPFD